MRTAELRSLHLGADPDADVSGSMSVSDSKGVSRFTIYDPSEGERDKLTVVKSRCVT